MQCPSCATQHWRNGKPGACAVVVRDDRVLLVRRAHDPWRDLWCAPGGFCNPDEHPMAAVEREVSEETGVRVSAGGFLGIWIDRYSDTPDAEADWISVTYYSATPVGNSGFDLDPKEVAEARWFAWEDVPAELAPPGTLRAVLDAWLRAGALGLDHGYTDRTARP